MDEPDQAYRVVKQQNAYAVTNASGCVITCHEELNAQHYAALLNNAYASGYKAGYKAGKKAIR